MAYFAPYIDGTGLHMPSREERLGEMWARYCGIFGVDPSLEGSAPDYLMLAEFARALDEVSSLIASVYESRNPAQASGHSMDLLLPQYGLTRAAGAADDECRGRIRYSLAVKGGCSDDSVNAAVRSALDSYDLRYRLYVNDGDSTDERGIPGHSAALVAYRGRLNKLAQALYDHLAPGIGTYGSSAGVALDSGGKEHTVYLSRPEWRMAYVYPYIRKLPGADEAAITQAVVRAVTDHLNGLPVGGALNIPRLYGVIYAADPAIAGTFIVTDILATLAGDQSMSRDVLQLEWNEIVYGGSYDDPNVTIQWVE